MEKKLLAVIEGTVVELDPRYTEAFGWYVDGSDGVCYWVFEDTHVAGEATRKYWEDLVEHDPGEFRCLVGDETLVNWCLGQYAGPGYTLVKSLEDWLDLWLDLPNDHFSTYDGKELNIRLNINASEEFFGCSTLRDVVAYRC